ncbi:undecaprenyl-phosphate glucose phosphotransferase [Catenovulum maritimum]|uniref:Capsular biosynthesis protein n=1 Tax=Catenovulum maritimum TaxID=1513271 RepID=A0A0J8JJ16_9ALTE|nr:undecaprenyl-phosphate glucose phosphotransferase [Catenovulum maritimum]KMT64451.1 capsular biosynthesis protein [Catenovulum maritimum]
MATQGIIRNNINQFAFVYRAIDFVILQLSLVLACGLTGGHYDLMYFVVALIANLGYFFTAELFWLYRSWRAGVLKEMLFYASLSWGVMILATLSFIFFSETAEHFSRLVLALWLSSSLICLLTWRICFRYFLFSIRKQGLNTRSVGIIGVTESGKQLAREILDRPETGYKLKTIFDERSIERIEPELREWYKGDIAHGVKLAKRGAIDVLFIALPLSAKPRIETILRSLGNTTVDVHLIPDFFIYNLLHARMGQVGEIQTVSVYDTPMRGAAYMMKRIEDLFLASAILCVIALPMMFIALGVKLSSPGPIIFKQDRYGMDGKKIKIWKFRSMTVTENAKEVTQATKNDARVTWFGAFLRKTSLDELPQFINVLQGNMSVVGPRPHAIAHNEEYREIIDYYMLRHKMKPGITGWAQINGWRGETDTLDKMQMRIQFDLDYIRNWSLWMDFKIVIFTFYKGFVGKNVY